MRDSFYITTDRGRQELTRIRNREERLSAEAILNWLSVSFTGGGARSLYFVAKKGEGKKIMARWDTSSRFAPGKGKKANLEKLCNDTSCSLSSEGERKKKPYCVIGRRDPGSCGQCAGGGKGGRKGERRLTLIS